jgi:hypothetical protein
MNYASRPTVSGDELRVDPQVSYQHLLRSLWVAVYTWKRRRPYE